MRLLNRVEEASIAVYDVLMSPRKLSVIAVAAAVAISACSIGQSPVSRDARDPSNPDVTEGVDPLHAPSASASAVAQATTYACPMHPEVTSSAPGSCPKCHMTLVPKK